MSGAAGRVAAGTVTTDTKELVASAPEERNWKGIIIAILVILIVFALIAIAVVLTSPVKKHRDFGDPFTFDDMFDPAFTPQTFDARWMKDEDAFVYRSREGEVLLYNTTNHSTTLIMNNSTFRLYDTDTYFVSSDLQYVLIAYDIEKVFRYSYRAKYKIFDRNAIDPANRLVDFPKDDDGSWENRKLQFAGWSNIGHSLTFVYDNNIYYQEDPKTEYIQITYSGRKTVYNGIPDLLYEEEIFKSHVTHWWSENSSYICYTVIDDTNVPSVTMPWYGNPSSIYSNTISISYPKAGDARKNINPIIRLLIAESRDFSVEHKELSPPADYIGKDFYVKSVQWKNDESVVVVWINRAQNHSIVTECSFPFITCDEVLVQRSTGGWVNIDHTLFINNGSEYLTLLPALEGSSGYWKHIALINENGYKNFLTQGAFDVMNILGFRESTQSVFYLGTNGAPRRRHIFSVDKPGANEKLQQPKCLSCDMEDSCQYVTGSFSKTGDYYILHCQGPGVPQYLLRSILDDSYIKMLEDNNPLVEKLSELALPVFDFINIKSDDDRDIWIKLYLPPLLNKDHITQYPLLIHADAAPGSQLATYEFKLDWGTYLSSTHNIIYAQVDGHGSAAQGEKWLHSIYKNLGTLEVQDQIRAAEHIQNFKYVDEERIGIWGLNYGGFVTAHALGDDKSDVFDCGISVAPITDFRYHDTAYSERYLGVLSEMINLSGYEAANVSAKASGFSGRDYMLVHGTADNNVHYQNTAQFVKALTDSEIDFNMQIYTDNDHSISGPHSSRHLYKSMTNFIRHTCWDGANPREFRKGKYKDIDVQILAIR